MFASTAARVTGAGVDVRLERPAPASPRRRSRRPAARPGACARSRRPRRARWSRARWRGRRPPRRGCRTSPRRCSRRATGGTWSASPRSRRRARPRCAPAARSACRASGPRARRTGSRRRRSSRRCVVMRLCPGRRRSSSRWISATARAAAAGSRRSRRPRPARATRRTSSRERASRTCSPRYLPPGPNRLPECARFRGRMQDDASTSHGSRLHRRDLRAYRRDPAAASTHRGASSSSTSRLLRRANGQRRRGADRPRGDDLRRTARCALPRQGLARWSTRTAPAATSRPTSIRSACSRATPHPELDPAT